MRKVVGSGQIITPRLSSGANFHSIDRRISCLKQQRPKTSKRSEKTLLASFRTGSTSERKLSGNQRRQSSKPSLPPRVTEDVAPALAASQTQTMERPSYHESVRKSISSRHSSLDSTEESSESKTLQAFKKECAKLRMQEKYMNLSEDEFSQMLTTQWETLIETTKDPQGVGMMSLNQARNQTSLNL